jgi:hypothetical protein
MTTVKTLRRAATVGVLLALGAVAPASAAGTRIIGGPLAAGGTWTLAAQHKKIGSLRGVCLDIVPTLADGTSPGTGSACTAGSLSAGGGIAPSYASFSSAGIVTSRARTVKVTFSDGKQQRIATKAGPRAWRHVLGASVRYYGADALPVTTAAVKRVAGYDAHGGRVAAGP